MRNSNWCCALYFSYNINYIKNDSIYWRHDLQAINAFITKDNINNLIRSSGVGGDIGVLSLDIDGNDYWVWEAIDCISPRIVICEYNSVFGPDLEITIPYKSTFLRSTAHHSCLFFGASLGALCGLARRKGYVFVGSNSAGCNAFFVREDVARELPIETAESGYVESRIRESRDGNGNLNHVAGRDRLTLIQEMMAFDLQSGTEKKIKDLLLGPAINSTPKGLFNRAR